MKNLDNDFIRLRNRICELERELYKRKKFIVRKFVINTITLGLALVGIHTCLASLGFGVAL